MHASARAATSATPTWRQILSSGLHVDLARFEPAAALRCTVGVAVPLAIALLLNQPGAGVFIAVGGVSVGFGSFQGAYRSRAMTMIFASLGMALSIFVGSTLGWSTPLTTVAAGLWGFAAGMLVALGPSAGFIGLQSAVAVLVAGAYPAEISGALARGALVLLGGAVQTIVVVSVWPLRRFHTERETVSVVYRSLASYATDVVSGTEAAPPDPRLFANTGAVHADPHPFAHAHEVLVFQALVDEAERLRTALSALSVSPARQHPALAAHLPPLLAEIATAVKEGRAPSAMPADWEALRLAATDLRHHGPALDTLFGQLRAAWRTAAVPSEEPSPDVARTLPRIRTIPPVRDALSTLRANLTLQSSACRHALRLAVALAFATAVYRVTGIPRGYWFAMTTLLVLKPEFRETFVTGGARIVGTLAGAGLATLLVVALGTHHLVLTALLLAFVWSGYALFRTNYIIFTICMTGYIVLLLTLAGVTGTTAAWYRVLDTVLGGVLALIVYAVWPTWESVHVPSLLAALLEALGRDARLLFMMYVEPPRWDPQALRDSRAAARLARSNAEASVERMLGEPAGWRFDTRVALGLLAAGRRYALGALAMHARLDDRAPGAPRAELGVLGEQIATSLERLAQQLRTNTELAPLPPLRQTQLAVSASATDIAAETDMMVDSVNTMAALLARPSLLERSA